MTTVPTRKRRGALETQTQRRRSLEHRDWCDVSTSWGPPKDCLEPPDARERLGTENPQNLQKNQHCCLVPTVLEKFRLLSELGENMLLLFEVTQS